MPFKTKELVFAIDVLTEDHDEANFELHHGIDLVRKNAITCGMTNNRTRYPTFEAQAFAVNIDDPDNFNALRDALRAMLDELNAVEGDMLARHAQKIAAETRKAKRKPANLRKDTKAAAEK